MAAELIRGSVCGVDLGRSRGREQSGRRFAIVAQNDELWLLNTVVVVPTSTSARPASFRPEVAVAGKRTLALCEQVRTVDARCLQEPAGTLTLIELQRVEEALELVLEL